jgi:hypothetical protein
MSAKEQMSNSIVINCREPLSREEGFWPFDDWDPDDGDSKGGPGSGLGDDSRHSIKNYPSSSRGPVGEDQESEQHVS